jgi:hypothetical protein
MESFEQVFLFLFLFLLILQMTRLHPESFRKLLYDDAMPRR